MNKKFLKHYMETNPEGTAQTYIFLVDNQDIALNIVMSGYQALCLVQEDDGYYFSADSFIEEMRSIQFTGICQSAYHYVTACTVKWMNDKLQTFFKDAGLDGKAGWQLFKEKEYLGKLDNQKEVEKLLEKYILRFERDPKEEPELSRFHLFDAKGNVKGVRDMDNLLITQPKVHREAWDDIYKMVLIASISFIAVLGNLIREYLPFNLLFVILVINVGAVLIRIYLNIGFYVYLNRAEQKNSKKIS